MPAAFPAVEPDFRTAGDAAATARAQAQGHARGYADGMRRAGVEAAAFRARLEAEHAASQDALKVRVGAEIEALAAARAAIRERCAPVLADAERTLFECALSLAEAVLGRELSDGAASSRAALARALSGPPESQPLRVRMNPLDAQAVEAHLLQAGVPAGIDVVAEMSLSRGDALADFPDGFLDARVSSALDRARKSLLGPDA
jgi:flagellar assembly protein FliH